MTLRSGSSGPIEQRLRWLWRGEYLDSKLATRVLLELTGDFEYRVSMASDGYSNMLPFSTDLFLPVE